MEEIGEKILLLSTFRDFGCRNIQFMETQEYYTKSTRNFRGPTRFKNVIHKWRRIFVGFRVYLVVPSVLDVELVSLYLIR